MKKIKLAQTDNPSNMFKYDYGDFEIGTGYVFRLRDIKIKTRANISFPCVIWDYYQQREKGFSGSEGYVYYGTSVNISKITDPVVLGLNLSYNGTFPMINNYEYKYKPGIFNCAFSYSEVLNDEIGMNLKLKSGLILPEVINGKFEPEKKYTVNTK